MRQLKTHDISHRLTAALLCLCMVTSLISDAGVLHAFAAGEGSTRAYTVGPTAHIVADSRVADPDTMDDYLNRLLTEASGSRYAGRVWTDKTVFAYGNGADAVSSHFDGTNAIKLEMGTDGYTGEVKFNSDFGHVFSALASSQVINEYPPSPVDLVIVFDMSGSMGQDTRYGIDTGLNIYMAHNTDGDGDAKWPEQGVLMSDRIANSRIQKTLDAINQTIDTLMEQNPQNRVAVCGYGANATVLMPLGHYKRVDVNGDGHINENDPYLSVGGMETLYHPSDLVYREHGDNVKKNGTKLPDVQEPGWYWMNNRDTCYTVVVNAEYNTYTGVLNDKGDGSGRSDANEDDTWRPVSRTVSNNVLTDDGTNVKAFPGEEEWVNGEPPNEYKSQSIQVYEGSSSSKAEWAVGLQGVLWWISHTEDDNDKTSLIKNTMNPTSGLKADDYVGYFTNTQGGIYLAYKQLADSTATTYTETLTNGVVSTVARVPAAIIMSDGGANFSFNEMGQDDKPYTAEDWNARYGQRAVTNGELQLNYITANTWTPGNTPNWNANNGKTKDGSRELTEGRYKDIQHLLGGTTEDGDIKVFQKGDEWYNVFIPGEDTLKGWDGLHGIYNQGADIYEDGTLSTPPFWDRPGVLYSSDNSPVDAPGTILEVLLTAAYMNDVVEEHYAHGWSADDATVESRVPLSTYTMNVDTEHVPQWGTMRLYPTLDPKEYPLDTIESKKWYTDNETFGENDCADGRTLDEVYNDLYKSWDEWKTKKTTNATIAKVNDTSITINSIEKADTKNAADYATTLKTKDGKTTDDIINVTDAKVINNIAYNDAFYDVTSEDLGGTFETILTEILGSVFVPISGDNDAGVGDSITYQDPIGEYMEIKNGAITATPHHIDNNATGEGTPTTYDMSLLVFGEMHGLVRVGVYDYQWNDAYMQAHPDVGKQGEAAFPTGWYWGDDPTDAVKAGNSNITQTDAGTYPTYSIDGLRKYENANEARADGWVFRVDYKTLISFVPIVNATTDETPEELPAQVKNTKYTIYRFAGSQDDRNELRRNPIYGDVPEDIKTKWKEAYDGADNQYPTGNEIYASTPGVYRLSDIRVWVEDTGDFVDTDGAIAPNSGYDRSLYVNIPVAAIPTELATITLGKDGVMAYQTNLGKDHPNGTDMGDKEKAVPYEEYCYQSTPFRLFYAVGLEDDLLLRDDAGNQIGVDFNKISPEYIQSHTVEGQDYIWFISNYYSNTTYSGYTTDNTSRTRGDPTVTFSPGSDNRYYVFQKPLPLYAHAYRVSNDKLTPVDNSSITEWTNANNRGGNGGTTWEDGNEGGASWTGGQYMGTYENKAAFEEACANTTTSASISPGEIGMPKTERVITDSKDIKYQYVEGGIVFLEEDLLDHVTSKKEGGYTEDSVSFSSDDYYFILLEFYKPIPDTEGLDQHNKKIDGATDGEFVQYALARKGSEFGSGFSSDNIDNGDMLCWTDMNGLIDAEFDYLSKTDTGDLTRGEPTFEKLTYTDGGANDLRTYLQEKCGIKDGVMVANPDYVSAEITPGASETITLLEQQVKYWLAKQQDPQVMAALAAARSNAERDSTMLTADNFNKYMQFAVATRPGGIRSGDMSNNRQAKTDNTTSTSYSYYLPTISDNSGVDNNVIINNFLGNNGRLEIANQMLHVTKMLEAPDGYTLTEDQMNETFNYQVFVQGVTGTRTAVRTEYNEYSKTWERELGYIDVLTDNSDLVQTNNNTRALFVKETGAGSAGGTTTAKQVIQSGESYYYANDDGTLPTDGEGNPDEGHIVPSEVLGSGNENLYYMYLPSNDKDESSQHVHRLYQNEGYEGDDKGNFDIANSKDGTTTFVKNGQHEITGTEPGAENRDSYRPESDDRPAGTKTYWAQDAELIPVSEVQDAEAATISSSDSDSMSGIATIALDSANGGGAWSHDNNKHESHVDLTYHTFVIRKPNGETSATDFTSPYATRSQYLTEELKFGQNANTGDGSSDPTGTMTTADLYDQIVPTGDRPDLFGTISAENIAQHTTEFTLHHGEGLLLTGLDNRIAYRFTEKLTDKQLAAGYTLQQISHVQQRGSESIYRLGIQEIPIYTQEGATYGSEYGSAANYRTENSLTWAVNKDGTPNGSATENKEPFAHTNAVMWEYYATMAAGTSGNHHQPDGVDAETESSMQIWDGINTNTYTTMNEAHTVADNPNCKDAGAVENLRDGYCDVTQGDSILHYMYYKGKLIDPHYNGEASTYMRNMARYGVSPTVHFEVEEERANSNYATTAPADNTGSENYTGVYSVFGNTGWFEEQANFINTFEPGTLSITKELDAAAGTEITEQDKETEFGFTLKLDTAPAGVVGKPDGVYNYEITKPAEETGEPGGTPAEPTPVKGRLVPANYSGTPEPNDIKADPEGTWAFQLKGGETMTVTGLPVYAGYTYTVKETTTGDGYDVKDSDTVNNTDKTVSGTVVPGNADPVKVAFTNTKKKPEPTTIDLKLQKTVTGTGFVWDSSKSFTFLVRPVEGNPTDDPIKSQDGWDTDNGYLPVTVTGPTTTGLTSDPVNVFEDMKFANVGTYRYTISEQTSDIPGISSDGKIYTVQVVVSEEYTGGVYTGKLKAVATVDGKTATSGTVAFTFTNNYDEDEIELPFKARKVLKGGTLRAGEFKFELTNESFVPAGGTSSTSGGELMPISGGKPFYAGTNSTQPNDADGYINFGAIQFTEPGTYTFTMKELPGTDTNIEYDEQVYTITVVIVEESGALKVQSVTYDPNMPEFDMPTFTNEVIGGLTISKTVTGTEGDKTKAFNFKATFTDPAGQTVDWKTRATLAFSPNPEESDHSVSWTGDNNNTLTFTLKDGESVDITGLPIGTGYTVTETEANEDGYTTTVNGVATSDGTGSIGTGSNTVEFVNDKGPEPETGNLQVTKTVTGTGGDKTKDFHFTVTLSDTDVNGTFGDMTFTNGVAEFTLRHDESATANNLPAGLGYTVTEQEANTDGYTTVPNGEEGAIPADGTAYSKFVNDKRPEPEPKTGGLVVAKIVTGDGDKTKAFAFTVTLSDTTITGEYGEMEFTDGVATFTLKHGESVTATGLPEGITYTVTETEANTDGYTTTSDGETGTIPAGDVAHANFKNRLGSESDTGGLVVTKTVTGDGDKDKAFTFTVTLSDTTVTGKYGGMTFTEGVATFTLKHGESVTATGLPDGITYTVTEEVDSEDGYTTTVTGTGKVTEGTISGTISTGSTAWANFTNHKEPEPKTGNLTVTKTVTGTAGDKNKAFNFTVTLSDTTITGEYGEMEFNAGVAEFTLQHGESRTAVGLLAGVTYTVTETEANEDGYDTTSTGDSGTITSGNTANAKFTNHRDGPEPETGNLIVSKTVTAGERNKAWNFTVTLSDTSITGTYGDMTFEGGVAKFTLTHGESKRATGLPAGITYTVTEAEANKDDYDTTFTGDSGTVPPNGTARADFVNHKDEPETDKGNLIVSKTVTGDGDRTKEFTFTVTLSDTSITGTYGGMTFEGGVAAFKLKHGESKRAAGLPAGITYTVTEQEANADGYTTGSSGTTGIIPDGGTARAEFVNDKDNPPPPPSRDYGNLIVTKTVTGTAGDTNKEWHFLVELSQKLTGTYGDLHFTNGVAEFTLKHGQSVTARNLPSGITYTVTETEANQDGYDTSSSGDTGRIPNNGTTKAEFVNDKDNPPPPPPEDDHGHLTVTKTVTGNAGNSNKEWHFRVELSEPLTGQYGDMYFTNGVAEFTLKHGQSATVLNLPEGIIYTVTESEANQDGYTTSSSGTTGTIPNGGTAKAEFVNDKNDDTPPPPDNPPDDTPKTGDDSHLGFWLAMMLISMAGVIVTSVSLFGKRRFVSYHGKHFKK